MYEKVKAHLANLSDTRLKHLYHLISPRENYSCLEGMVIWVQNRMWIITVQEKYGSSQCSTTTKQIVPVNSKCSSISCIGAWWRLAVWLVWVPRIFIKRSAQLNTNFFFLLHATILQLKDWWFVFQEHKILLSFWDQIINIQIKAMTPPDHKPLTREPAQELVESWISGC